MAEWLIHVTVVAEPYYVPTGDDWIGDRNGLVAITTRSAVGSPAFKQVVKGRGYVSAFVGGILVVGVYFSPNRTLSEFEQFLVEIGALIGRCRPNRVLVAGDFNAKSLAWGSPVTDVRGEELEEWAVQMGLIVINRGSVQTCVRQQGGSIVDITFANAALACYVQGWQVMENVETLSDHRYIRFKVSTTLAATNSSSQPWRGFGPRWSLKRLDRDALIEAALVQVWVSVYENTVGLEQETEWLRSAMTHICDAAMPRIGPQPLKTAVYWWSQELQQLRRSCVTARRQYARCRRRRIRNEVEEKRLYAVYRSAIKTLQGAIRTAKDLAETEMLSSLNADPWGRPYKM
ncbi:jg10321, partial [Pararge aegeria aegeria]